MTGFSAYFGLLDCGKPKENDTVVVSGAAPAADCVDNAAPGSLCAAASFAAGVANAAPATVVDAGAAPALASAPGMAAACICLDLGLVAGAFCATALL